MAYFLPSYFQKRLLRYALTRLDFIETDALNLEDLDIKFGQRSVVELKNVGIKVAKLIERLQLPPALVLDRALIRKLRVTVPADLHVSGIVVEVDGVDIEVEIQEDHATTRTQSRSTPSNKDVANQPRLPTTSLHDPGGPRRRPAMGQHDSDHVIPTSQDLAMSFVDTAAPQEREELEAALQSQSYNIQESTASLSSSANENGIGMPGGFSLPGFVASFFAGIADRLSVSVKNVEIIAGLHLPADGSPAETVKVVVRLAELSLAALDLVFEASVSADQRRRFVLNGLELLLLCESEAFSQHSTASSPKLSRSRSKASSTFGSDHTSQFDSPESKFSDVDFQPTIPLDVEDSLPQLNRTSSHTSSSSSSKLADLHPEIGVSFLGNSQLLQHSNNNLASGETQSHQDVQSSIPSVDNREHAEAIMEKEEFPTPSPSAENEQAEDMNELTESKLFSHDQAESLYMSALSTGPGPTGMPGAWATSEASIMGEQTRLQELGGNSATSTRSTSHQRHDSSNSQTSQNTIQDQPEVGNPSANTDAQDTHQRVDRVTQLPNLIAKRLVHIDHLTLSIPASQTTGSNENVLHTNSTTTSSSFGPKTMQGDKTLNTGLRSTQSDVAASYLMQSSHVRASSRTFVVASVLPQYEITGGHVIFALDMSIGRILVKTMSEAGKIFSASKTGQKNTKAQATNLSASVKVRGLEVHVCQSVPETLLDLPSTDVDTPSHQDSTAQASILCLSLSGLQHEIAQDASGNKQKLTIEKIVLGQGSDKVLYFVDSMNVRDSVATSMMIRPHDLVITNADDRLEVQLKPVYLVLDLLLMDDVLSRGGGLSSLMDLGNSVLSTGTVKEKHPRSHATTSRPRTVRFDSRIPEKPDIEQTSPGLKIDIRISGASINLIGSETCVQLKTSAIKLVSRQKTFRAQIDNAALLGPILHGSRASPDINVKVASLSVVYVDIPAEDDLDRLLSLLTPSSDKYDEEDDIMVDTLIRQRRKGGVMRVSTADIQVAVKGVDWYQHVSKLTDELSKLSAVSKYLPEDDRPGMLTFGLINKLSLKAELGGKFGTLNLRSSLLEGAHISIPSLVAAQISTLVVERGEDILVSEVIPNLQATTLMGPPMLMCRFIADEMDPTVRVKVSNTQVEYTVPTLIAIIDLSDTLMKEKVPKEGLSSPRSSEMSSSPSEASDFARKVRFSLAIRNSSIALNPGGNPAKGLLLLSDVAFGYGSKQSVSTAQLDLRKASILIIDDAGKLGHGLENADHKLYFEENDQVQDLTKAGYVPVGSISNASALVKITEDKSSDMPYIDVEFRNNLFLLETCADSTQTLVQILSGLSPPSVPSTQTKYRTEIVPIQDMLASFTGNAFVTEPGPELGMQASQMTTSTRSSATGEDEEDDYDDDDDDEEDEEAYASHRYQTKEGDEEYHDDLTDSYMDSEMSSSTISGSVHVAPVSVTASEQPAMNDSVMAHSMLDFRTDHFARKSSVEGTAHRWDSTKDAYGQDDEQVVRQSPMKLRVRDMHIIWNLFDGYDWQSTRDTITQAVQEIETKAASKQSRRDARSPGGDDDESVIGDFLFNSIYIGIPATKDPRDLTSAINQDIGDLASETGSTTTGTTITAIHNNRGSIARPKQKKLRLNRSRQHKLTFELRGVSADVLAFPPGSGEVESSVDVRVNMLEIFDHVPTSTWKKFATYMHEAGEREVNTDMVHIELLCVKPVADLDATEFVLKLTVLPLRLHVDQDALDFMTRFFEFKDDRVPVSTTPSTPPYFQRVEVNPIALKLDFKPKRVDYGGLRSGRTTEFMNFFVLDRADMVLRRVILYGVSGLDRVGIMLNGIWSPDVRRNQLPGVLAGLAPIRSLVDVGSGVRDLVAVPIREYRKDGRIVRSIQKGAFAFAKTTTTELVNLGAKLAIGTQTVLQNAEDMLVPRQTDDEDDEVKRQISLYADQPIGIVQGLRGAYASLERDLLLAKDAIVAVPGEVMASGSAAGAAKAILKSSPIIILRPAIGASKAVGQTLLGAGNTLDRKNLRRIEEKYKRHF